MSYELNIDWQGEQQHVEALDVKLLPVINQTPGQPILFQQKGNTFIASDLEPGNFLLSFRYFYKEEYFDSYYFDLDIPEITLIQIKLTKKGSQIQTMGFINEAEEFVDMLIYEDQKPFLTRPVKQHTYWQTLAEYLAFRFKDTSPQTAKQQISAVLSDLSQSFPALEHLWPYQLKMLLQPAMLAQTSAEWKACLLHLLQNNLILMEHEGLFQTLQEAIALAQQQQQVQQLLDNLEWDPETQSWLNFNAFLEQIKGHHLLLPSG